MAQATRRDQIILTLERSEASALATVLEYVLNTKAGLPLQPETTDALADIYDTLTTALETPF